MKTHLSWLSPILVLTIMVLTGCTDNSQSAVQPEPVKKYSQATTLQGIVSNDKEALKAGSVKVTDLKNQLIASTELHNSNHYQVEIPAGTQLPLILSFTAEASANQAEPLKTVVVHTTITKYDINPLTSAIAQKALQLGGYTHANMIKAAQSMVAVPDAKKTSAGFHGDPTTQYGGWH